MTTEILRNIMYRQADNEQNPEREDRLATVGLVVLDEVPALPLVALHEPALSHAVVLPMLASTCARCQQHGMSGGGVAEAVPGCLMQVHYLGDPGRGSVWEETIINCPPHIRLLAMSATIANAHDLGGWISQASSSRT